MPATWESMAERMETAMWVHRGTVGGSEYNAGGSDGCVDCAGRDYAKSDGACRLISGTSHYGSSGEKPGRFRSLL